MVLTFLKDTKYLTGRNRNQITEDRILAPKATYPNQLR